MAIATTKTNEKETVKAVFVDVLSLSKIEKSAPDKKHDRMVELREDEPAYAKLIDRSHVEKDKINRHGNRITLVEEGVADSLGINHDFKLGGEAGLNPDRNKQHGFHFTADNCIGCHACESACSEKNDLPAHLAFRSVGYVEGGSFPDSTRMNISMACNHCDDPVCLKGCPTRAYTKHAEYGAVIQDPNICFGCGYCTWVCPYNAPQLDPVAGQVEKCNMCVDRLEEGLKPACVSACVGNALDFGVIEELPSNREAVADRIPGFPDPSISKPNIRFQQLSDMPDELSRTDSAALKYKRDKSSDQYKPALDQKAGVKKYWNLKKLSSSENPLVIFTLAVQGALGLFFTLNLGAWFGVEVLTNIKASEFYLLAVLLCLGASALGLLMSTSHIGKPLRFYRGFNNLRHSPVSREGLGIFLFMAFMALHLLLLLPSQSWLVSLLPFALPWSMSGSQWLLIGSEIFAGLALIAGVTGLYYMYRCYRIPARPFWNHWSTGTHFVGNGMMIGALACLVIFSVVFALLESLAPSVIQWKAFSWQALLAPCAVLVLFGSLMEMLGLFWQAKNLEHAEHEGAASHYIQQTTFGYSYRLRNALLALNVAMTLMLLADWLPSQLQVLLIVCLCLSVFSTALIGRAIFYVLVVPTTMPGAFFWKNKGFEAHARDIGLADNPNSGLVPSAH